MWEFRGSVLFKDIRSKQNLKWNLSIDTESGLKNSKVSLTTKAMDQYMGIMPAQTNLPAFVERGGARNISTKMLLYRTIQELGQK